MEAYPTTKKIYSFPEFDFLTRSWTNHLIDFNPEFIVGVVNTAQIPLPEPPAPKKKLRQPIRIPSFIPVSEQGLPILPSITPEFEEIPTPVLEPLPPQIGVNPAYIQDLLKAARRSMVGLGHETIHDEDVRASSEIPSEYITLYPQFMDYIRSVVSQMALQLGNSTTVEPRFYKLVLYQEGDHFEDHIDNEHVENMIMTLSVEFPIPDGLGGDLVIEKDVVPHPNSQQLGLTLFYHDTHHKVTKVQKGNRMSLIFDVVQNPDQLIPQVIQQYLPSFQLGIQKLRLKGVKRIGTSANHMYIFPEEILPSDMTYKTLKGMDRIFWELLRTVTQNIFIEDIATDGARFYFGALIPIMKLEGGFSTVYNYREEEDENQETVDETEIRIKQNEGFTSYDEIKFDMDTTGEYRAVHPKYRMGNVVLLRSKGNLRLTYHGDQELHTGNEGFYGEIWSNLGIFAEI